MTQGLRRELRKKFEGILHESYGHIIDIDEFKEDYEIVAGKLADAAKEVRAFQFQPQTIEQAIYMDVPVTDEIADTEKLKTTATKAFEAALGFNRKGLPWWDGDKDWKELGEWVCDRYQESKTSFGEYQIWRSDQYASGKMSNKRIAGFPAEFYFSWDDFMRSKETKKTESTTQSRNLND